MFVRIPAGFALYATDQLAILAPQGWRCFGLYGSDGDTLIAAPELLSYDILRNGGALSGPAIQMSRMRGDTSGRFDVARAIARFFPDHMTFTAHVIAEDIEPAGAFPRGPYPADTMHSNGPEDVTFTTPGGAQGMGTASRLIANPAPIIGFVHLTPENDLVTLQVRVPSATRRDLQAMLDGARGLNGDRPRNTEKTGSVQGAGLQ